MERIDSSGVIPYRRVAPDFLEVLLITSSKTGRWVIPKGRLEPHMTPLESALEEAYEEAGVSGEPDWRPLGTYQRRGLNVLVFPLLVTEILEQWPEDRWRQRRWFTLDKAVAEVDEPRLKDLIASLGASLAEKLV